LAGLAVCWIFEAIGPAGSLAMIAFVLVSLPLIGWYIGNAPKLDRRGVLRKGARN
jgi:hypothetical protein